MSSFFPLGGFGGSRHEERDLYRDEIDEEIDFSDSSSSAGSTASNQTNALKDEISKKESVAVLRLRQIVILILIGITLAVSFVLYLVRKKGESQQFNNQYDAASEKIVESFEGIVHKMGAISGLVVALTSQSVDQHSEWPFVSLSNFQERAGNALELSGALFVRIAHLVGRDQFDAWEEYVRGPDNEWVEKSFAYQEIRGTNEFEYQPNIDKAWITNETVDVQHYFDEYGFPHIEESSLHYYLPTWQTSPLLQTNHVNENMVHTKDWSKALEHILRWKAAYLGELQMAPPGNISHEDPSTALFASLASIKEGEHVDYLGDPMVNIYFPVFDHFDQVARKVVGVMASTVSWRSYFQDILPSNARGIAVVLEHACRGEERDLHFTFLMDGPNARVVGEGDHHDPQFDAYMREGTFAKGVVKDGTLNGITLDSALCDYRIRVYPTKEFYDMYNTKTPIALAFGILVLFLFMISLFLMYDRLVERRQKVVLRKATQSTQLVSSLFPKNVRDRLMDSTDVVGTKVRLKSFMNGDTASATIDNNNEPIADLFPNCTVFFADIAGFTAWSSSREPSQVFILLQAVYQAFDAIAKRRKVFKVETIGDCYMAVTGLPEPQQLHALVMVRFAFECLRKIHNITRDLENTLGPDTAELTIRVGVHSGPVTAGVLRGDRARFQLFGDTVNTASRMESTGYQGKIQCSESTAAILRDAGKEHWLETRKDMVQAKGKGTLQTYWVTPISKGEASSQSCTSFSDDHSGNGSEFGEYGREERSNDPEQRAAGCRMVNWMTDLLLADIRKIVRQRLACRQDEDRESDFVYHQPEGKTCMDEVKEVIGIPAFNPKAHKNIEPGAEVQIEEHLVESLKEFVSMVGNMYHDNPFHNFEHACHVTMSVVKLLKRIVAPELSPGEVGNQMDLASRIHLLTYGINSDPLTQFAMTFSALIHDVDHRGISNVQMIKEEPGMAQVYRNKSIAEQNSLELAWGLLMENRFLELRRFIFGNEDELLRFRQIIVNVVLATDIFDRELNDLRKSRWSKAFSGEDYSKESTELTDSVRDVRATIVLEHIIQASDVSHTMQHWHVYQRWNKRLLNEMYAAYQNGRLPKDPCSFWYKGELGFFDNYVIPLAKKLKECGVFGVSSDEYLNYALQNRAEWATRGEEVVAEAIEKFNEKEDTTPTFDDSMSALAHDLLPEPKQSQNAAKIAAILAQINETG